MASPRSPAPPAHATPKVDDSFFGFSWKEIGEIDMCFTHLSCAKNHTKKCFETITCQEDREAVTRFWKELLEIVFLMVG